MLYTHVFPSTPIVSHLVLTLLSQQKTWTCLGVFVVVTATYETLCLKHNQQTDLARVKLLWGEAASHLVAKRALALQQNMALIYSKRLGAFVGKVTFERML